MCIDGTVRAGLNFIGGVIVSPCAVVAGPVGSVMGVVGTIFNFGGWSDNIDRFSKACLGGANIPLQVPFDYIISVLNPDTAEDDQTPWELSGLSKGPNVQNAYKVYDDGFLSAHIAGPLRHKALELAGSKYAPKSRSEEETDLERPSRQDQEWGITTWCKRHVFSRALMVIYPIVAAVTRVADFAIGLVTACFAIILFGRDERLNGFTKQQLTLFSIVSDICLAVRGTIYPQQFVGETKRNQWASATIQYLDVIERREYINTLV